MPFSCSYYTYLTSLTWPHSFALTCISILTPTSTPAPTPHTYTNASLVRSTGHHRPRGDVVRVQGHLCRPARRGQRDTQLGGPRSDGGCCAREAAPSPRPPLLWVLLLRRRSDHIHRDGADGHVALGTHRQARAATHAASAGAATRTPRGDRPEVPPREWHRAS
eukprot:982136-Prymnesium_polylepis.1